MCSVRRGSARKFLSPLRGLYCRACRGRRIHSSGSSGRVCVPAATAGMSTNTASALCYLVGLVTGIIFLVLDPYNKNKTVRFHAFQSIFFHVGVIVAMIALTRLGRLLSLLTHGLAGLLTLVFWPLLMLAIFVLWLYLMWAAYNNKMVVLPIVGPLAQKQA